jgi:hypothetical protein
MGSLFFFFGTKFFAKPKVELLPLATNLQENLLIGSWIMQDPTEAKDSGASFLLTDATVQYLKNGTSSGAGFMHFVSGKNVEYLKANNICLTYYMKATTHWLIDDGILCDSNIQAEMTPEILNEQSKEFADWLATETRKTKLKEYGIIELTQTRLVLQGPVTDIVLEDSRSIPD